jgi:hypothetical protein
VSIAAIVTGLGHGLASWGFGGGAGGYDAIVVAGWIRIVERSKHLHTGDIAEFDLSFFTYDDELADPSAITIEVDPPGDEEFNIAYGDSEDAIDRVTRLGEGRYRLRIEATSDRGTGITHFRVTSIGALQASEPGQFIVR